MDNPFRIAGTAEPKFFTDREVEINRMVTILREPQAKLVVYGPRRMGKSSALEIAARTAQEQFGLPVIAADVSTVSGEADIGIRLMQNALKALGTRWQDTFRAFAKQLSPKLTTTADPATGIPMISLEPALREASDNTQRHSLGEVLDAIDELAEKRGQTIGIMLDEFQDIRRFGGEQAEWHLRGTIQKHKHVSYILAGSQQSLILAMIGNRHRAFYDMAERLYFGPIDADHMATWIDERMEAADVQADGIGGDIVTVAGPRTRDRVQLARQVYTLAASRGHAETEDVTQALEAIVNEFTPQYVTTWRGLSPVQQNVLRAVAADAPSIFSASTRQQFALGATSSTTTKAVTRLEKLELIARDHPKDRITVDSPFFGHWVRTRLLRDVGIV